MERRRDDETSKMEIGDGGGGGMHPISSHHLRRGRGGGVWLRSPGPSIIHRLIGVPLLVRGRRIRSVSSNSGPVGTREREEELNLKMGREVIEYHPLIQGVSGSMSDRLQSLKISVRLLPGPDQQRIDEELSSKMERATLDDDDDREKNTGNREKKMMIARGEDIADSAHDHGKVDEELSLMMEKASLRDQDDIHLIKPRPIKMKKTKRGKGLVLVRHQ